MGIKWDVKKTFIHSKDERLQTLQNFISCIWFTFNSTKPQIKSINTCFIDVKINHQKLLHVMKVENKILQNASITTEELG